MPICLPTPNQEFDGMTCTASGWGLTKDKSRGGRNLSQSLQKVDLPIVAYTTCHDYYRFVNPVVQNTMICAGPEAGGKGTCQGDSGGPCSAPGPTDATCWPEVCRGASSVRRAWSPLC
ncbi:trypsin-1-like [Ixodes scapularis]